MLEGAGVRRLLGAYDESPAGVRDLALLGAMVYILARVSVVVGLDAADYYHTGRRMLFRLTEKGGQHHEMPAHHSLVEFMDAYLTARSDEPAPLFQTIRRSRDGYNGRRLSRGDPWAMVKRRSKAPDQGERFTDHSLRASGITAC